MYTVRSPLSEQPPPLAARAQEAIREALLTPGAITTERLTEGYLARELSMSRTPVREALHRLALTGMVEPAPGGGYRRRRPTLRGMREQCELRLLLEPHAAQLAAQGSPVERQRLLAVIDATSERADEPLFDLRFHVAIADAARSDALAAFIQAVVERMAADQAQLVATRPQHPDHDVEHVAIADALRAGDAALAAACMSAHLRRVEETALSAFRVESAERTVGNG